MSSPTNFLQSIVGFNVSLLGVSWGQSGVRQELVRGPSGVGQESVRSQSRVSQKSFRILLVTNLESWFEQLSKLKPDVISNKFLIS